MSCEKSLKVICLLGEERISFWCMVHHLSGYKDSREKTNEQSKIVFRYKIYHSLKKVPQVQSQLKNTFDIERKINKKSLCFNNK